MVVAPYSIILMKSVISLTEVTLPEGEGDLLATSETVDDE
jgi:hypothetical protein